MLTIRIRRWALLAAIHATRGFASLFIYLAQWLVAATTFINRRVAQPTFNKLDAISTAALVRARCWNERSGTLIKAYERTIPELPTRKVDTTVEDLQPPREPPP